MIFLCKYRTRVNFVNFLTWHPLRKELSCYIKLYYYEFLKEIEYCEGEKIFFLSMDHMNDKELGYAQDLNEFLSENTGMKVLVEPSKTLDRYGLLKEMYRLGLNKFTTYRPNEDMSSIRFPVFIRSDKFHHGALSELIYNPEKLERNIKNIAFPRSKYLFSDLLITEFCETDKYDGFNARHSAFLIDNQLVPRHILIGDEWHVKFESPVKQLNTLKKYDFLTTTNPHEDWVRNTFEIAGLKYGRIDYGVSNGHPQVWEINQTPSLFSRLIRQLYAEPDKNQLNMFRKKQFDLFYQFYIHAIKEQSDERIKSILKIRIPLKYRNLYFSNHLLWRANYAARKRISRVYRMFNPG